MLLMGDVCLCEYMSHGHCGIVDTSGSDARVNRETSALLRQLEAQGKTAVKVSPGSAVAAAATKVAPVSSAEDYEILNDASLELISARTAVSQAQAGMDIIAPSDMMDGRVEAIRSGLDAAGYENIPILSYAAKFASGFYS